MKSRKIVYIALNRPYIFEQIVTDQRPVLVKNVLFYSILWYSHSVCNFHSKYTNNMPVNRQYIFGQILTNQRPVSVEDVLFLTQFYDIHTQCAISFQNIPITCLSRGNKFLTKFRPIRGRYSLKTYFFRLNFLIFTFSVQFPFKIY